MSSFGKDTAAKQIIGSLDTKDYLKIALAIKAFLESILDPKQPTGTIYPGAIPSLQKLLALSLRTYDRMSDEYLLVFNATRNVSGTQELKASEYRTLIERHITSLTLFNSSRIARETVDIDRAAELHVFVSAICQAAGGPKALLSSL